MSVPLPDLLDPRKAVLSRSVFEGSLPLARLSRLSALLATNALDQAATDLHVTPRASAKPRVQGKARYRLVFGRDDEHRPVVSGRVQAALPLRCQRCADCYWLPVDAAIRLALVQGIDEAGALPDHLEPLLLEERLMRSSELIEDELILAIPAVPRHPEGLCEPPALSSPAAHPGTETKPDLSPRVHPFAALAALKGRHDETE